LHFAQSSGFWPVPAKEHDQVPPQGFAPGSFQEKDLFSGFNYSQFPPSGASGEEYSCRIAVQPVIHLPAEREQGLQLWSNVKIRHGQNWWSAGI